MPLRITVSIIRVGFSDESCLVLSNDCKIALRGYIFPTQTAEAAIVEEAARAAINQQEDMKRVKDDIAALKGAGKLAIEPLVEEPADPSQKAIAK